MDVLQLPIELQLSVIRALDYKSLLGLSATNQHFRAIFLRNDKELLKHALLDVEENCSYAWSTTLNTDPSKTFLPCYGCHRLLLKCYFTSADWYSSSTRKGPHAFRRRCVTCQCSGKYKFTRASRILLPTKSGTGFNPGLWVYCGGCKLVTHMSPYSMCGIWDHRNQLSFSGLRPKVPPDFRCVFCVPEVQRQRPEIRNSR